VLDLTIIIPNYNTRELLKQCIASIYQYTSGISFEIICVDDNSKDGSADMVAADFSEVVLIRNTVGQMYAKNNNIGMRLSKARYVCLLNSDTKLIGNAFGSLVNFMDLHPDAAACGPKLLNPDMTLQNCIRRFGGLKTMILQGLNWHRLFPDGQVSRNYYASDCDYEKEQIVDSIGTTAFIIRRSTWETAGMLDERFQLFHVDTAYNLMLQRKGYKVYYTPSAEVIHYGSQSINQTARAQIIELHRSLAKFNDIYDYFGSSKVLKFFVRLAVNVRCLIKLGEYHLGRDKRVIKGPGAPRLQVAKWGSPKAGK
jgi:GT2 family glycosyltransferase